MKRMVFATFALVFCVKSSAQIHTKPWEEQINIVLNENSIRPFNGVVLISQNDTITYSLAKGYSDLKEKIDLVADEKFYIGSLTKQITAVLVLQAVQNKDLRLTDSVGSYLPDIPMSWRDSVTIHHLLNHTHGIESLNDTLSFQIGTTFSYSGLGYGLLGEILEKVNEKSYRSLVYDLFQKSEMRNSTHPSFAKNLKIAKGHSLKKGTNMTSDYPVFGTLSIPGGGIISNAGDLLKWNLLLHQGNLLNQETYALMTKASAEQNHSLFGKIGYGYGIRISNENGIKEIGHTGYIPGYISMNFYYPESNTSLIILENFDWQNEDIKKTFLFELKIREIVRNSKLVIKS